MEDIDSSNESEMSDNDYDKNSERFFKFNFQKWKQHLDDFVNFIIQSYTVPIYPFTDADLRNQDYNRLFLTVDAVKDLARTGQLVSLPPLFESSTKNQEIMIYYNLYLQTLVGHNLKTGVENVKSDKPAASDGFNFPVLIPEEYRTHLNRDMISWSSVTKLNVVDQLKTRIAHLTNSWMYYEKEKNLGHPTYNKAFVMSTLKMKKNPYDYFKPAIILMGVDETTTETIILEAISDASLSKALPSIKSECTEKLKTIFKKKHKKSKFPHFAKSACSHIFYDFVSHHRLI